MKRARILTRGEATVDDLRTALDELGIERGEQFVVVAQDTLTEARARRGDPATSHAAAASIAPEAIRDSQQAVLSIMRRHADGVSDEALTAAYGVAAAAGEVPEQSPSGIRTRRHELVEAGLVIDTGQRSQLGSGRAAIIWRALPPMPEPEGRASGAPGRRCAYDEGQIVLDYDGENRSGGEPTVSPPSGSAAS